MRDYQFRDCATAANSRTIRIKPSFPKRRSRPYNTASEFEVNFTLLLLINFEKKTKGFESE